MVKTKYKRVLLKLSGEDFSGKEGYGIDAAVLSSVALQIKQVAAMGLELGIVVGGGNIWRGAKAEKEGMDRVTADYAGMLATVINAIALQDRLEKEGIETRVQSAIEIQQVAEPYIRRRAVHHLEEGRVVIFAAGIGSPYVTADTAGALRAIEIGAEVLLKAIHAVDGVYDSDPRKDPAARKFDKLTYLKALNMRLQVMDSTALSLCLENKLPIIVFNIQTPGNLERVVLGEPIGTLVSQED